MSQIRCSRKLTPIFVYPVMVKRMFPWQCGGYFQARQKNQRAHFLHSCPVAKLSNSGFTDTARGAGQGEGRRGREGCADKPGSCCREINATKALSAHEAHSHHLRDLPSPHEQRKSGAKTLNDLLKSCPATF